MKAHQLIPRRNHQHDLCRIYVHMRVVDPSISQDISARGLKDWKIYCIDTSSRLHSSIFYSSWADSGPAALPSSSPLEDSSLATTAASLPVPSLNPILSSIWAVHPSQSEEASYQHLPEAPSLDHSPSPSSPTGSVGR